MIGFDGATFEILTPLIERGLVPALKQFIDNGASGPLESAIPPIAGLAWFALATGISLDESGVYYLLICRDDSYHLKVLIQTH